MTLKKMIELKELFEDMGFDIIYEDYNKSSSKSEIKDINDYIKLLDINYYIKLLADKHYWKKEKMDSFLGKVYDINPEAVISIILKEIAIELDKMYPDHIRFSPQIYAVSMSSGKVIQLDKTNIKTLKSFAAFRTKEDAELALKVIDGLIPKIF